jgi:hypothetical protein
MALYANASTLAEQIPEVRLVAEQECGHLLLGIG